MSRASRLACRGAARLLACSAVLVCSAAASAETLEEAWSAALQSDFTVLAAEERLAAAAAELDAARAERLPTVAAQSMVTRWNETPAFAFALPGVAVELPFFTGETTTFSEARVSMPVFSGGMLRYGVDAASSGRDARERELAARLGDVKLAVAERFLTVLRAESALAAAEATTASLAAHARDVENMRASGQVPRNDALASLVSLADAEQRELQARNALEIANAAFNRALGRALDAPVTLVPGLPPLEPVLAAATLEQLVEIALANRAELAALDASAAALAARSQQTLARGRPQLMLAGTYTAIENEILNREDFWSVGVGVRWELYAGGRHRAAAAALSREAQAVLHQGAEARTGIELEVRTAWLDRDAAARRVGVAERAVAQAEENLRVVRDRYRTGEGTNSDVLDAETLRAASRTNFDNARFDAALAELELARAIGAL